MGIMANHIHFIGIGGSGLSAIARLLLENGCIVSGSDRQKSPVTEALQGEGIDVMIGHRAENILGADLIVRSSAVTEQNPEVQAAYQAGIPVYKRADFLKTLTEGKTVVAIAGTHGKTTTTAMVAWTLSVLNQDPSFIIGGISANLGTNAKSGTGSLFVIEADEYDRMFLGLDSTISVVTNVEHDHPDCYPTPNDYHQAFLEFVKHQVPEGVLLGCGDDPGASHLLVDTLKMGKRAISYGIGDHLLLDTTGEPGFQHTYQAQNLVFDAKRGGYCFDVMRDQKWMASVNLQVPGEHNVRNAMAAMAVSDILHLPLDQAAQALNEFRGSSRRFEICGTVSGITVIDDYAHHPTEIRATLAAARQRYMRGEIWAVWQPHTYSRTQTLFEHFGKAFKDADHVLVTDIYAAREPIQPDFSARMLAAGIKQNGHPDVQYIGSLDQNVQFLLQHLKPGDVLLVLSAGDADKISSEVLDGLRGSRRWVLHSDHPLIEAFGERVQFNIPLARYTSARIGGPADILLTVQSAYELAQAAAILWQSQTRFVILGSASNVLVSDAGVRGVVIINQAEKIQFGLDFILAESGASLGMIARQAAAHGLSGLEWAAGIPGTLGGAVIGNAGAHDGDMAGSLLMAEILQQDMVIRSGTIKADALSLSETWEMKRLEYSYRSSVLKENPGRAIVLATRLRVQARPVEEIQTKMDGFLAQRKRTQPPGASMGSIFKNPDGDYAGRLIESCGLKGVRVGNAEISPIHANFFINHGNATANDFWALIKRTQRTVAEKFGIRLVLEIERIGDWQNAA